MSMAYLCLEMHVGDSLESALRHPLQHETAADINQLLMTTLRVDTRGPGPP